MVEADLARVVNGTARIGAYANDAASRIHTRAIRASAACDGVAFLALEQRGALGADVANAYHAVDAQLPLNLQTVLVRIRRPEVRGNDGLIQERRCGRTERQAGKARHAAGRARIAECRLERKSAGD